MAIYTLGKGVPKYIGASTDTKPTAASPQGQLEPQIASTFFEHDTNTLYITYDRTNWVLKDAVGEVKTTPTSNTLLDRVKALLTGIVLAAGTAEIGKLAAGAARIGTVSGVLKEVRVTKAIDAALGAYAANDVISEEDCSNVGPSSDWDFLAVARANGEYGVIVGASIISESESVTPRLTLFLFNAAPTGSNLIDNAANTAPDSADLAKYVGKIDFPALESLGTTDSVSIATPSTVGNLPLAFKCAATDDLFGILVTRDVFTQTPTDDITIVLLIEQY